MILLLHFSLHLIALLTGGPKGFSEVIWKVTKYKKDSHISLTYNSFDGEEGNIRSSLLCLFNTYCVCNMDIQFTS